MVAIVRAPATGAPLRPPLNCEREAPRTHVSGEGCRGPEGENQLTRKWAIAIVPPVSSFCTELAALRLH
eukprot:9077510-Alexandrium_andersonii.AAC.1